MRFTERKIEDQGIDMTPLVDTIIQLIIYFAVATTFVFISGMRVSLPKAAVQEFAVNQQEKVVISIDRAGEIFLDREQVNMGQLETRLRELAENQSGRTLVIQADKETLHGTVVTVLDLARSLGFAKLAIATEAKPESEPEK
jgi:biopolymer transport protein ExbD/biopolymer transport protein TolR